MTRLEEIKSRLEKATPGEWHTLERPFCRDDDCGMTVFSHWDPHKGEVIAECNLTYEWEEGEPDGRVQNRYDANFIAHAPADVRYLLDELEKAKEELKWRRAFHGMMGVDHIRAWLEDALKVVSAAAPLTGPLAMYQFEIVVGNIRKQTEAYFAKHSAEVSAKQDETE